MKIRENSTSCKKLTRNAFTKKYQHNKWLLSLSQRTQSEISFKDLEQGRQTRRVF